MVSGAAFGFPAKPVVHEMCTNNKQYSRYEKDQFKRMKKLFGNQEDEAYKKCQ
jgi:hypothetical protein